MKRSHLIVFYLVLISFPVILKAQQNSYGTVTIASPTAGALGKYADIPVSYHTGIPQIEIPLYTVKAGSLELPIGLSYHASGLKVIETASWVGAGWSLNAGGVITRTVMGLPDERGTGSGQVDLTGYYTDSGYNKYLYLGTGVGPGADQDWQGFSAGRKDGEPDLFFFNFGGYSGKFFFRDDHTPILVPQQDIKIIPYLPPSVGAQSIQGFKIITPDGNQYLFGNTPNVTGTPPIEITNPFSIGNGYSSGTAISSWYLNKVISYDSVFYINLTYTPESYGYYTLSNNPLDPGSNQILNPAIELGLIKNIISGVKLSQITFPNGKVDFVPGQVRTDLTDDQHTVTDSTNTSATSLGAIKISNNDTSFCKKYIFSYGYFVDNNTTPPTMLATYGVNLQTDRFRLRLDSVKEQTCDNLLQIPARSFTYFSEMVPRRITLALDHWGFFNGVTANQTLIPTYSETTNGSITNTIVGANRDANWPAMRGGSLNKMTYPTGGSTIFDFEPADSYTKSITNPQTVNIDQSFADVHRFTDIDTQTVVFVSNGNTMTIVSFNNTQDYTASVLVKDVHGSNVYSTTFGDDKYPTGQTQNFILPTLPAGTYWATLSVPTIVPHGQGGATVHFQQTANITQIYNITIGGLRIKTITQQDCGNNSIPIITTYSYPSGGYLYSFPTYVQHIRNDLVTNLGYWDATGVFLQGYGANNGCPLSGSFYVRSGGSLRPMANTQGYHIGYQTVNVSQLGNGYSQYNYHTTNGGFGAQSLTPGMPTIEVSLGACESSTPNYPAAPLPFDYLKGELYYEEHHNQNGDLLKQTFYYPTFDTSAIQPTPAFIVTARNGGTLLFGTLYNIYTARKTIMHTIETNYTPGFLNGVQQDTYSYYGSLYHNQVTRKVTTTSTGDSLITRTIYAPDFHSAAWDTSPSCEATYTTNCNTCQSVYNAGRSACTGAGADTCVTNRFLDFRRCLSSARNNYVNSRFANYTGINPTTNLPSNNYATLHTNAKNAAGPELKPILDLQDENRIAPIEISDYRDASLLKANFTRYDYVPYPANIPFPNKTQLVSLANPSSSFTNAVISSTSLLKDSRYLDESTYGFNSGNVTRVSGHDGLNTIYIWDYFNTNPIAKTVSATTDSTAFSSFEADGTGNWNLSTGGGNVSQVSINVNAAGSNLGLFTTQTPATGTANDGTGGQEVGMKFTSAVAGTVKGVRFYKTSGNTGTHTGELYSSTGTRLASATFTGETSTGWQTVNFTTPVSITANTTYTVAYFSSAGNFTEDDNYFLHNSVTNGVLTAPADGTNGSIGTDPGTGQGTFKVTATAAFPNQLFEAANYWVDVIFTPSSTAFAFAGSNQTITLPTSSVVLNGSGSTGSVTSYSWTKISGPGSPAFVSPSSTFSTVTGLTQGVYVFQLSVNSGASTSQVTINVLAAGTPTTIFSNQTVPTTTLNDGQAIEIGVKFRTSTTGTITGIRFYKTSGNTGTHIGELYSYPAGTRLAQATFSGETSSGWQTVLFSTPINVAANTTYVATYWSSAGNYSSTSGYLGSALSNGTVTGLADGPDGHNSIYKYTASAAYPSTYTVLADKPNYWVDVIFLPDNSPVPSAGNNLSVILPVSSVTLNGSNSIGNISNYQWTKVSGPGSPVIVSPTSATTNVTGLTAGNYVFQLAVNGASNSAFALTGTKSYNMTGNAVSKSGLTSGKKYIVSYWSRGPACNITGGTSTSTTGRSVNGWIYYEHIVTMTSSTVTITGSSYIDELRLYPQGAQMSSYTYQPVVGITTMNDPNSEVTYYEYDGLERLKNVKDYQGNIGKNYQYNYANSSVCGLNFNNTLVMQTFGGTNTLSYPVGVFNVNYKLLGNAINQAQYVAIWMLDTADSHIGTLVAGSDSMHFNLALNSGRVIPNSVMGMRYYQYDLAYNQFDGFLKLNGEYVDFGDGIKMYLGKTYWDTTNVVLAANTVSTSTDGNINDGVLIHSYPDSTLKTITFYHNDSYEVMSLDPHSYGPPAISLTKIKNLKGYCPQNTGSFEATSLQQRTALTMDSIRNWNSINSLRVFAMQTSNNGLIPNSNLGYAQDFMKNNANLNDIVTAIQPGYIGYYDSTFKLTKLKSNWNTYFTNLVQLIICDDHWNREDLSALINLSDFRLVDGNHNHSNDFTGNSSIPIPSSTIDNIFNQIAAGSGQHVSNGTIVIYTGGTNRTSASDSSYNFLISKGWHITFVVNPF